MPKTGFFNDNEYRAYPFVDKRVSESTRQENSDVVFTETQYEKLRSAVYGAIVDAGFVLGIDCDTTRDAVIDFGIRVWVKQIAVAVGGGSLTITFGTTATDESLSFTPTIGHDGWLTIRSASNTNGPTACNEAHWRGFIVSAGNTDLPAVFEELGVEYDQNTGKRTVNFADGLFEFEVEPGRIQNKEKSYLRSVTVGNRARIQVPECGAAASGDVTRPIVVSGDCISGPLTFKEGYNCQISQINRSRTFTFSGRVGAGAQKDGAYCANYGEIKLEPNEAKPVGSKFYSGGPACDELLYTINGVTGKNIAVIPGAGITISVEDNKIIVGTRGDLVSECLPQTDTEQ